MTQRAPGAPDAPSTRRRRARRTAAPSGADPFFPVAQPAEDPDAGTAGAPAVVAVLVTRDPGPWLEECLAALGAQDYEELSVLVLVAGGSEDPTPRVAAVLPEAYVRRLDDATSFAAAADEVTSMVEGAAFLLFCHDDCAPAPDAVHVLVEESFRSNAGVVGPKMVRWEDPSVLLHVGMSADKTGAVVERVQEGEVDHGQHDAVRDVFFIPGGFTLVRADLFAELGGFDPAIVAMGEDLDLCWRAQVAGARVVVAPEAVVRHLEALAGGARPVAPPADGSELPSLQGLQRRHELRSVLVCYSLASLLWVLPFAAVLALGELVVALAGRDRARARVLVGAWGWNLGHPRRWRAARGRVRAQRRVKDREVRALQVRGSARLTVFFSRLTHQGLDVAQGRSPAEGDGEQRQVDEGPLLTGSVGLAFSEDADFDELDDLGHRSGRDRFGRRRRRPILGTSTARLVVWLVAVFVLLVGTRGLFGNTLPLVGQFARLPDWSGTWHQFFTGWQATGVGTTAPATPAFAVLGALGTVFLGGMGLTQKVLVLGCVPFGAWGLTRMLRPLASPRARLAAGVAYLGLPLAYNAIAQARWDALVAFAALPWIVGRLARLSALPPFGDVERPPGWRGHPLGQVLVLGVIEAVAVAFAPAVAPAVVLTGLGLVLGSSLVGQWRGALRALAGAIGGTVVALVLLAPWVVGTLAAGHQAVGIFGLTTAPWSAPTWSALVRFAVGPTGSSPLGWLLVVAALLPLLIARQSRLAWAARLWSVALLSWLAAWASARGWAAPFSPSVDVLLAPAAVAVAASIGLGVAAFERDLSGYRFGWRQAAGAAAVVLGLAGLLPVVAQAGNSRWGLVANGYAQPLGFLSASTTQGPFRVLWLGDPRALPLGGWSIEPGLAYGTSENGVPDATSTWAPAGSGPASTLADAVELATSGRTSHLGRLLVPASVRYVVVVESLAPTISGIQSSTPYPAPGDLLPALLAQADLRQVPGSGSGFELFANTAYVPQRAGRAAGPVTEGSPGTVSWPTPADTAGWFPEMPGPRNQLSYDGNVGAGTFYAAYAPAGDWSLAVAGRHLAEHPAYGWAAQYTTVAGPAELSFSGSPLVPLGTALEVLAWLVVAAALAGRRWWLDWWWQPLARRRSSGPSAAVATVAAEGDPSPSPSEVQP